MTEKYESELERSYEKIIEEIPVGQIKSCLEYESNKKEYQEIPPILINSATSVNQLIDNLVTDIKNITDMDETQIRNLITIDTSDITIDNIRTYVEETLNNESISLDNEDYILYLTHNFIDYFSNSFSTNKCNNYDDLNEAVRKLVQSGLNRLRNFDPITGAKRIISPKSSYQITREERLAEQNKINIISEQFANIFLKHLLSEKCKLVIKHEDIHKYINQYNKYELLNTVSSIPRTGTERFTYEDKEYQRNIFKKDILKETYKSAKEQCVVTIPENSDEQSEIFLLNGTPLPMYLLKTIMKKTENTKKAAMNNIYSFLWNQDISLRDRNGTEYIINVENIHILGIKTEILNDLKKEIKVLKENGVNPKVLSKTSCPNITNYELSSATKDEFSSIDNSLKDLSTLMTIINNPTIDFDTLIKTKTEKLNKAQKEITTFLKKETNKIDTLIYFIYKKTSGAQTLTIDTIENIIEEIFDECGYLFEKEFIDKYRSNNLFNKRNSLLHLMMKYKSINKNELEKKYQYIEEVKDYLAYVQRQIAYDIITTVPESNWENYFENENKEYNLGYFGLADFYINNELLKLENLIVELKKKSANGERIDLSELTKKFNINIFKIYDKTLYLNHFNYLVDIKKVYITDLQYSNDANIICEMEAIHETLLAFFKKNEDFTNQYKIYSAQNIDEATIRKYAESSLEEIIPFNNTLQETLFCLVEMKLNNIGGPTPVECYSNIITQAHSDFKRSKYKAQEFIEALKNRKVILRYATAKELLLTSENDTHPEIFSESEKIINNLISCSNAITWLNELTQEEFIEFSGIKTSYEEFIEIKSLLYANIINNLLELANKQLTNVSELEKLKELLKINKTNPLSYDEYSIVNITTKINSLNNKDLLHYIFYAYKNDENNIIDLPYYLKEHLYRKLCNIFLNNEVSLTNEEKMKYQNLLTEIGINLYVPQQEEPKEEKVFDKIKKIISKKSEEKNELSSFKVISENQLIKTVYESENDYKDKFAYNIKFIIMPLIIKEINQLEAQKNKIASEQYEEMQKRGLILSSIENFNYRDFLFMENTGNTNHFSRLSYLKVVRESYFIDLKVRYLKEFYSMCNIAINPNFIIKNERFDLKDIEELILKMPKGLFESLLSNVEKVKVIKEGQESITFNNEIKKIIVNREIKERLYDVHIILNEFKREKELIDPDHGREIYIPMDILNEYPVRFEKLREKTKIKIENIYIKYLKALIDKVFKENTSEIIRHYEIIESELTKNIGVLYGNFTFSINSDINNKATVDSNMFNEELTKQEEIRKR